MRWGRAIVLLGVGLLWLGMGPLVLLLAGLTLLHPRVRGWLRPTRRVALGVGAVVVALGVALALVPAGWVPLPPGQGRWVTPEYVGRPATASAQLGPVGDSPSVVSRSYGLGECSDLVVAGTGGLVALCGGDDPVLRLIDPDSLRTRVRTELPGEGCPGQVAAAPDGVVAASGRRVVLVDGADLAITTSIDVVPAGEEAADGERDCLSGVGVDGAGRLWFATRAGVVGVVADGRVRTVDLDDRVEWPLTVADDGAYVAGERALHRVGVARGRPTSAWAVEYDAGGERGSSPVVLPGGRLAVADNRDPRLQLVVHRADNGEVVCRAELFDDGTGAAHGGVVAAGDGVVVTNADGYGGAHSAVLGRTTSRGIGYVDRDCTVSWTVTMNAPSGRPAVSTADGLAYVWTKRHSWFGVDAWYLSALDLDSGRLVWARRTGLSALADLHRGAVVLGPERTAYATVWGGLVRVRDRG